LRERYSVDNLAAGEGRAGKVLGGEEDGRGVVGVCGDLIVELMIGGLIWVEELGAGGAEAGAVEGAAEGGEVAVELGGGGDEGGAAVRDVADLGLLVAEEEEGVVAEDGATNDAAELIAFERVDRFDAVDVAEVVGGIEDAVADELEEIAVEGVGA
jgi:hypothetical protein